MTQTSWKWVAPKKWESHSKHSVCSINRHQRAFIRVTAKAISIRPARLERSRAFSYGCSGLKDSHSVHLRPHCLMSRIYAADGDSAHGGGSSHGGGSHVDEESHHSSVDEVINIRGDQFDGNEKGDVALLNLNYTDLWALGLTTSIGSHFLSWSSGLSVGFGSYIIAVFLMSMAYYCLILCISELSSAIPFAGGAYGIARVTLGIFPGFLVGIYDSCKSVLCVSAAAFATGRIITAATDGPKKLQPLYWTLFYLYTLTVNGRGGVAFWRVIKITAAVSAVCLLLIFILGSIKFADFGAHAALTGETGNGEWFQGGMHEFIRVLPSSTRFFVGIQSINLACGQIKEPKLEVPKGSIAAISTVTLTSLATVFVVCSLPPGISVVKLRLNPLSDGFALIFEIDRMKALWLSLPAVVTYGLGYMYMYGKQISAMGKSGMLPFILGHEIPVRNTPVVAHVAGAVFGYGICTLLYFEGEGRVALNNIVILGAMAAYMSIFISFVVFRNYFPTIKREFVSPLGTAGAVYGFLMFLLVSVSFCGFQDNTHAIQAFCYLTVFLGVYYYCVVRHRQIFSEEEKKVMFKAYLVKNNMDKKQRIRKRASSAAPAQASSHASLNLYASSLGGSHDEHSSSAHHHSSSAPPTPHTLQSKHTIAVKSNNNNNQVSQINTNHSGEDSHHANHTPNTANVRDKESSVSFSFSSFSEHKQPSSTGGVGVHNADTFIRPVQEQPEPGAVITIQSMSNDEEIK